MFFGIFYILFFSKYSLYYNMNNLNNNIRKIKTKEYK